MASRQYPYTVKGAAKHVHPPLFARETSLTEEAQLRTTGCQGCKTLINGRFYVGKKKLGPAKEVHWYYQFAEAEMGLTTYDKGFEPVKVLPGRALVKVFRYDMIHAPLCAKCFAGRWPREFECILNLIKADADFLNIDMKLCREAYVPESLSRANVNPPYHMRATTEAEVKGMLCKRCSATICDMRQVGQVLGKEEVSSQQWFYNFAPKPDNEETPLIKEGTAVVKVMKDKHTGFPFCVPCFMNDFGEDFDIIMRSIRGHVEIVSPKGKIVEEP